MKYLPLLLLLLALNTQAFTAWEYMSKSGDLDYRGGKIDSLPDGYDSIMYAVRITELDDDGTKDVMNFPAALIAASPGSGSKWKIAVFRSGPAAMTIRSYNNKGNSWDMQILDPMFSGLQKHVVRVYLMPSDIWIEVEGAGHFVTYEYQQPIYWPVDVTNALNLSQQTLDGGADIVKKYLFKSDVLKSTVRNNFSHLYYGYHGFDRAKKAAILAASWIY